MSSSFHCSHSQCWSSSNISHCFISWQRALSMTSCTQTLYTSSYLWYLSHTLGTAFFVYLARVSFLRTNQKCSSILSISTSHITIIFLNFLILHLINWGSTSYNASCITLRSSQTRRTATNPIWSSCAFTTRWSSCSGTPARMPLPASWSVTCTRYHHGRHSLLKWGRPPESRER